jgi:hypothetical protein
MDSLTKATLDSRHRKRCFDTRKFFYKWGLIGICALCVLFTVNLGLNVWIIFDRDGLYKDQAILREAQRIIDEKSVNNRKMLDARARIQTTFMLKGIRAGIYSEEEKRVLEEEWDAAEYSRIAPNPFKEEK